MHPIITVPGKKQPQEVVKYHNIIIIIKSEISNFPIVAIFFRGCVPEVTVPSCAVGFIYVSRKLGAVSIRKTVLPGMKIPMVKIRRPNGRLIFNMEITIRR